MNVWGRFCICLLLALVVASCDGNSNRSDAKNATDVQSLEGKTVSIIVGFNPGGGTDTTARLLNRYLAKHTPGNPDVIIQNMNGAAGIRALNHVYERGKPDGQTLLFAPISLLVPLLGEPGIRYELSKFEVVGGLRSGPVMQFVRNDVLGGDVSAAGILQAEQLRLGGIRTSSSLDLMPRMALDILEKQYRYVTGYSSENSLRNAVQNNEVNSFGSTFASYRAAVEPTLVDTNTVIPLWQFPYRSEDRAYPRSAFAPEIPTFMQVYESLTGAEPSGDLWDALKLALDLRSVADNMLFAPPGTDPVVLAELREGFTKAVSDPEMIAEVTSVLGYYYEVVPIEYIQQRFLETGNVNPEVIAFIQQYIADAE
jgi:tripartite-type tricarboxylate transporter receptor subunit TctC